MRMRMPEIGTPQREPEIFTPREPLTTSPEQPDRGEDPKEPKKD
ncbi:hypothetical protein GCM10011571_21460 [Marinithermofilum abyssi]|uniref:Uncharacterized protein n=1 Tax=Marinithermofilum abyssi TaxID=1571185 RepID=A0A8J2YDQ8_9BACL|nr:hypothetical protein [Marinithermofilum abyssi]GGE19228.1 hypothetical protein GCM10011571_21460 [Marinithermofilum abyssi]